MDLHWLCVCVCVSLVRSKLKPEVGIMLCNVSCQFAQRVEVVSLLFVD